MKLKQIEGLLLSEWNKESKSKPLFERAVTIYTWPDAARFGLRVAEVGFVEKPQNGELSGTSGSSFMQSDSAGLLVCALVERLAIEADVVPEMNSEEEIQEQLIQAVFGK